MRDTNNLGQNTFSFANLSQTTIVPTDTNPTVQNKFTSDILKDAKMSTEEKLQILERQKEILVDKTMLLEAQSLIQKISTL